MSYARESLVRRSTPIEKAANQKLFANGHKSDEWAKLPNYTLAHLLLDEVLELCELLGVEVQVEKFSVHDASPDPQKILKEEGDILNCLRFIADKHGAL